MALGNIGDKISSSGIYKKLGSGFNGLCDKLGPKIDNILEKHPNVDKFLKTIEPTGANNAFLGMSSLMVGTVIVPRVLTAKKRNPDNKEATKDEIKEILFRDVQTVLIILFSLKAMNSLVAAAVTKRKGIPLTNKPYKKLFDAQTKGFKGIKDRASEFVSHPIEKFKTIGKNLLDTLHPTKGVIALTNEECTSKYSNFNSIEEIEKLLNEIQGNGGDAKKAFNEIMDSIIKKHKKGLEVYGSMKNTVSKTPIWLQKEINEAESNLAKLENLKKEGPKVLKNENGEIDEVVERYLLDFFKDKENSLVKNSLKLNATLRSIALFIEMTYLGFGLPALNEKRLEKKYLKDGAKQDNQKSDNYNPIINNNIKAQEIKLFHNFIK